MARRRNPTPSYLPHKTSGRARAVWTDPAGGRHDRLLPGRFGSPASREAFARLSLELAASPAAAAPADPDGATVAELLLAYLGYADRHYRGPPACRPTRTASGPRSSAARPPRTGR